MSRSKASSRERGRGASRPASGGGGGARKAGSRQGPGTAAAGKSGRNASKGGGRDLKMATLTGVGLGALVVGLLFVGPESFFGLVVLVLMLAQAEFYRATRNAGHNPAAALGLVGGAALLAGVYLRGESAAGLVIVATLFSCLLWYMSLKSRSGVVANVSITMLGLIYIPLLGSFVGLLAVRADGRGVTIVAIGAAAVYDIFAYAGGSKLGRHKMAPSISPNKSWEGAGVATLATIGSLAYAGPLLGPWSTLQAALVGAAIAFAAPMGDLVESMIKRDLGVKDMGTILPGHGGALDRIDAILFTAPTVYLSLKLFGL
ncbi:MAG: phosphatidate cytidylyltransferase [Actinomycetota bacterium]